MHNKEIKQQWEAMSKSETDFHLATFQNRIADLAEHERYSDLKELQRDIIQNYMAVMAIRLEKQKDVVAERAQPRMQRDPMFTRFALESANHWQHVHTYLVNLSCECAVIIQTKGGR